MKTNNTYFKIIVFLFLTINSVNAQVGIGTTSPNGALDITSTTDGLLIPRVALTITTSALPLTTPTISELIYNSATVADVTPGYYYWDGAKWVRLAAGVTNDWSTTGNTGIVDGTNFIGTAALTNVDVAFRRNNLPAGKIGLTSTSFGVAALNAGAASNSSAFGTNALTLNTGANNVAFGNGTLAANVTGIQNTGMGNAALAVNTGSASTAIGFEALKANTSGNNGTAVGFQALSKNIAASNNTAIGFQTMLNNTTGSENTALGFQASSIGASGSKNTSVGYIALNNNVGTENTAIGHSSMSGINNAASRFNTAIGFQSMFAGTGVVSNVVAVGANALFQNTASNTVGVGYNALQGQIGGGTGNTGVGFSVLNNNANGDNNTAVGSEAGFAAVGSGNTLIGFRAGQFASNVTGAGTFVGFQAGQNTTGANNTVVGNNALVATGASANNVAIGNNSLTANTGTNNTAIGYSSLVTNNGSGNVAIGNQAGFSEAGSNKLYITNSNTSPTTSLLYGDFSGTRILRTNSTFQIGDPAGTGYVFPLARGTINQYLASDASGVLSWTSPPTPDPLPNSSLSVIRGNLSANQILTAPASNWEKIAFNTEAYDTNGEFTGGTFTCTKNGFYQINAGYHTDVTGTLTLFGIAVYVNGVLYQENTHDHNGGQVSRTINCTASLSVGQTVEIYVRNPDVGRQIDSFSGKTYFEVIQIR
jgi:trimeric autotransporter adhesin